MAIHVVCYAVLAAVCCQGNQLHKTKAGQGVQKDECRMMLKDSQSLVNTSWQVVNKMKVSLFCIGTVSKAIRAR